jgi:hypothetical protein
LRLLFGTALARRSMPARRHPRLLFGIALARRAVLARAQPQALVSHPGVPTGAMLARLVSGN